MKGGKDKMKQRKLLSLLLALAMVFAMAVPAAATEENAQPVEPYAIPDVAGKLVVLHTNDTHGRDVAVEGETVGTAGVAALKADFEAAGATVLLLSAGDFSQGTTLVSMDKGASAVAFMNAAGYDAASLGNHEFDYKMEALSANVAAAEFPVLAANIVNTETGKALFGDHVTFDTPIGKVGVFGLDTPETMTKAHPDNVKGLTFYQGDELVACAQAQVDALTADGCEYIIALSHLGVADESEPNRSTDVFAKVTGVDLIVDGHSHTVIDGGQKVGDALLVSTGEYLNNVGVVITDGTQTTAELVSAAEYTKVDEAVAKVVNDKDAEVKAELDKVFAKTEILLNGERDPGNRTQETNLGDFAADAILWAARQARGEDAVDVALTNGGGIRASIEAGDITMNHMKTVFPFGNAVATIDLTGAELLEALEAATCSTPTAIGAFPQVAGISFTIDISVPYENGEQYPDSTYYAPAKPGSRVKDVTVNGEALDLAETYTLATNDFTAAGGDTYGVFIGKPVYDTSVALEDALVNYTRDVLNGVVTAEQYGEPAGRITIVGEAPVVDPEPEAPKYPADVTAGAWFYDAAVYVLDGKIMNGTGNGFEPTGTVTRGTVYQTLYNMEGRPTVAEAATFNDVSGKWYADAAAWAEDTGLTTGTGDGQFSGDRAMTRQELAKVFADYAAGENITAEPADLSAFTDAADVAAWAKDGMQSAVALGILKGSNNALNPTGTAIRAELAQILLNYSKLEPAPATYTETAVQIEVAEQDGVPAHTIDAIVTLPVGEGTFPAVVMLHGTGSNKDEAGNGYAMAAPQMAEAGLASIRIDFMGTAADKADDYRYYSYTSANIDAKAAADYVAALDAVNGEQIAVMGWSQGGTNALLAAAAYPETFSAVVTWAGALDLTGLFGETAFADAKAKAEADGAFTMTLDWRTPSDLPVGVKWFEDVEKTDVLAETAKITAPVLAIHGEKDDTVPPACAGQIAEAAANGSTHMIPECDHTFNVFSGDFTALNNAVKATADFILGAYAAEAGQAA